MNKTKTSNRMILLLTAVLGFLFLCQEHPKEEDLPLEIEKYEFLEFSGGQAAFDPEAVLQADNNWQLLLACKIPKTKKDLKEMGISCTKSQTMLLEAMGFIEFVTHNDQPERIMTTLSILGHSEKQALILNVRNMAHEFVPEIEEDIHLFMGVLKKTGHIDRAFSIFFSFIVDGIAWFPFRSQSFVPEFELTIDKPLYDGIFWAYAPKREFRCGTNIALGNDLYVLLNWSDGPQKKIQKVFNWTNLNQIHKDLIEHGKIVHTELCQTLEPYGIIDAEGKLTVLAIEMKKNDPIFPICQVLAMKVVQFIEKKMDRKALCEEFGFSDEETAFVVTYHEWMWELMEHLVEKGFMEMPHAFENPEKADPQDIGRLIFVVKGKIDQSG